MAAITQARLKELLNYDPETGVFTWLTGQQSGEIAGTRNNGYLIIRVEGHSYPAHRLGWFYIHGTWPDRNLDHVNRTRDDNRLKNLREATPSQNAQNVAAHKDNNSGVRGILWDKSRRKWVAELTVNGKLMFKQRFNLKEEAVFARKQAEKQHHPFRAC